MKELKIENFGLENINVKDQININGGGIAYWIGYAMGILMGENEKLATENPQYVAMTHAFSH